MLQEKTRNRLQIILSALLAGATIFSLIFYGGNYQALGATYTFTQTNWSGGNTGNTAVHPTNQSGWNQYSTSTNMAVPSSTLTLGTSTASVTQTDSGTSVTGFNLTGASFSSTTVSGSGSSASVILGQTSATLATSTIATSSNPIYYTSEAMGQDGFPRIVYGSGALLQFIQCTNSSCSTRNITTLDSAGNPSFSSIQIASDGFARIISIVSASLRFIQCTNASCSTNTSSTLTSASTQQVGLALGSDGFGRIVYQIESGSLGYFQCSNASCSTNTSTTIALGNGFDNFFGLDAAITLGSDGFARISNVQEDALNSLNYLHVVQCANDSCSSKTDTNVTTTVVGYGTDIAMGQDGFPRVTYIDSSFGITFMQCTNATCSTRNTSLLGSTGFGPAMRMDSSGFARIVYRDFVSTYRPIYVRCTNASCSSKTTTVLDINSVASAGHYNGIALDTSDNPFIDYIHHASGVDSLRLAYPVATYYSSGTFTSGPIDTGGALGWGNLSWTKSGSASTTITMKARSSATSDFSGAPAWSSCSNISSGAALSTGGCVTNGHRYIEYQANLSTSNTSVTPSLDDVTIGYVVNASSGNLISSAYDTGDNANAIGEVDWDEDASLPSGTTVTVSLRTASSSADLSSASWTDFTNAAAGCSKVSISVTCSGSAIPTSMKDSSLDRWFQYKVALTGAGNTPTVTAVRIKYVTNVPPQFNPAFGANGVTVSQNSTSTDLGKVAIQYQVRDPDTNTGSSTPGLVTPSFEYNIGGSWTNIPSQYLASGDLDNKPVSSSTYTQYSATWDVKSQIPGTYAASAQVRVTANDNEGANNLAFATSSGFVLDTKNPSTTLIVNGPANTLSLNISDDSNIQYRLSNNADFSADGQNAMSGQWQTVGGNTTSTTPTWTPGGTNYKTVYFNAQDIYGNTVTSTYVAPGAPANFDLKDISNVQINQYQLFISWGVYSPAASAQFANYKIYRSTNGTDYSLLTTITDVNLNYYRDTSLSSSTMYYYKLATTDTDNDISPYSSILSHTPNGQGGTDFTPPTITGVVASTTQATWATITWTTDELSDSEVDYSASTTAFNLVASSTAYMTAHSVTLTGLNPNTQYFFRVKSRDPFNNVGTADNGGAGYTFTTLGGPAISDVVTAEVTNNSATITWNTNKDSDSYVVYATNLTDLMNGVSITTVGSASPVGGPPYQHNVTLTGLSSRTTYYYYVKSTASGDTATDTNGGNYYSFKTTYDTKAPVITAVSAPVITKSSAIIVWQTDEPATSQVEYGTATGVYANATNVDSTLSAPYHNVTITDLNKANKYYYRVKSADGPGNSAASNEYNFTTTDIDTMLVVSGGGAAPAPQKDTTPPKISGIEVKDIGPFGAIIAFSTDKQSTVFVTYGKKDVGYEATAGSSQLATKHEIKLAGLKMGADYQFKVEAEDQSANFATSDEHKFTTKYAAEALSETVTLENASAFQDKLEGIIESVLPSLVPPFITKPEAVDVTEGSASITWKSNVPSYGAVAYGTDKDYTATSSNPYAVEISAGDKKERDHRIDLTGLSPSTIYHLQAKGFVIPGVVGKSKDETFTTKASRIKAEITRVGNTDLDVRWVTPEDASSFVEYRNLASGKIGRMGDDAKTKNHSVSLQNLEPDTSYQLKIFGYDANNNIVEGDPVTIKTKKDIAPPEITNIRIDNALVPGRADRLQSVVSWRTDEPATSIVNFEEGVGVSDILANQVGQEKAYTTDHIVIITSLKPSTVYRIQIQSTDESGNVAKSNIRSILTPKSAESVLDVITKNLQETFGFLKKLQK